MKNQQSIAISKIWKKIIENEIDTDNNNVVINAGTLKGIVQEALEQAHAQGAAEAIQSEEVADMIAQAHTIGAEVERERWINQPANEHDEAIRQAERARILKFAKENNTDQGFAALFSGLKVRVVPYVPKGEIWFNDGKRGYKTNLQDLQTPNE